MSVTRKDVAKLANVSETTVSFVMNNKKNISPAVSQRVLEAAKALNYHPNMLAKSMVTKETRHIAMLVDNVSNPHYASIMQGVQHVAYAEGYIISLLSPDATTNEMIRELVSRGMDGLILALPTYGIEDFSSLNLPVAYENESIRFHYRDSIFEMVKAFRHFGHRRLAFLSGRTLDPGKGRYMHFRDALKHWEMEIDEDLFIGGDGPTDEQAGYEAADRLLRKGKSFTGIFAINDLMAIGAMKRLREEGLRIPEDVSIAGCDGVRYTSYTNPPLSTIRSDAFKIGEAFMYHLISQLHPEREIPPFEHIISTEFILRESIGPAPQSGAGKE